MNEELYLEFLDCVPMYHKSFVNELNTFFINHGCKLELKPAKSGYVASYRLNKKVICNFVFRKKGMLFRLYGDNYKHYHEMLEHLPASMQKEIATASACKRLIDPQACNSKCHMGYDITIQGNHYLPCRYDGFMFLITDESKPYIKQLATQEILARSL